MRMRLAVAAVTLSLVTAGCAMIGQSKPQRAQEAALELNLNARFGRMELAAERISPKAREQFFERRKAWGGAVRVADYDLTGLKIQGEDDAESFVKIAWYRADDNDLRITTLKQKWHADGKGDWKLTEEQRISGDLGLFGEPPAPKGDAPAPAKRSQFPTIHLGAGNGPGAEAPAQPAPPTAPATAPEAASFGEAPPPRSVR